MELLFLFFPNQKNCVTFLARIPNFVLKNKKKNSKKYNKKKVFFFSLTLALSHTIKGRRRRKYTLYFSSYFYFSSKIPEIFLKKIKIMLSLSLSPIFVLYFASSSSSRVYKEFIYLIIYLFY